ncbi:MAG: nucleotidyltransferase family protein [Bacteroidales bacterium]|jgi:MurNAc alpha-1-phosphate uridylyltransferase|nr:nucleotidyltransferase family protein [Bacteroidales bacterium]
MKALIFAAGLGTRLRPITDTLPKALVPVAGVPMLERVLCKLRDAGIDAFVVNVHHFAEQIEAFLSENVFGVPVAVSREEREPLETGGGIRHAAPLLASSEGRFLVHNADILSNLDINWFLEQDAPENLATLLLVDAPADRYLLFDDDMRLAGWTNVRMGEVKSPYLPDFDPAQCRRYSFCGIHIVSEAVFEKMAAWPEKFSIIDFYLSECAGGTIRGVVAPDLHLIDIGSPEKLAEAQHCPFL